MLFNNKKDQLRMLQNIQFTSKASLKTQCLYYANGNIKEAKELYEFLTEDMKDLPATDPVPPTWQENTKSTINGALAWFQQNQGTIAQGIDYIRGLMGKGPVGVAEEAAAEPLEEIN